MSRLRENLLVQFSVVSLLVMAAIAVVLALVLSGKVRSDAINHVVDEAVGSSSGRLLAALTPADLEVPMTGQRYDSFHEFVQGSIVSEQTARVKIWAKDGTVIYSNDQTQVGDKFPNKKGLVTALPGDEFTEVSVPEGVDNAHDRKLGTLVEVYTPIVFPGTTQPQGAFEIYQFYAPVADRISRLRGWVFGSIGIGFLVLYGGLVSIVWGGWRTITRQRSRLESFNVELEQQVEQRTAELQEAQDRLVHTERLAAIGELSAGVAHELRNPLGAIKNATYYVKEKLQGSTLVRDNPRLAQFVEIMEEEVDTSDQIITDLMDFARVNPASLSPTRPDAVVESALSRMQIKDSVNVIRDIDPALPEVQVDAEQLRRALANLIKNADDAMPEGGDLIITGKAVDGFMELHVRDTGQGIPGADLTKVFDPLFTTKAKGIGLGLAIVRETIQKHNGSIGLASSQGEGTTFTVRLPLDHQGGSASGSKEKSHDHGQTQSPGS